MSTMVVRRTCSRIDPKRSDIVPQCSIAPPPDRLMADGVRRRCSPGACRRARGWRPRRVGRASRDPSRGRRGAIAADLVAARRHHVRVKSQAQCRAGPRSSRAPGSNVDGGWLTTGSIAGAAASAASRVPSCNGARRHLSAAMAAAGRTVAAGRASCPIVRPRRSPDRAVLDCRPPRAARRIDHRASVALRRALGQVQRPSARSGRRRVDRPPGRTALLSSNAAAARILSPSATTCRHAPQRVSSRVPLQCESTPKRLRRLAETNQDLPIRPCKARSAPRRLAVGRGEGPRRATALAGDVPRRSASCKRSYRASLCRCADQLDQHASARERFPDCSKISCASHPHRHGISSPRWPAGSASPGRDRRTINASSSVGRERIAPRLGLDFLALDVQASCRPRPRRVLAPPVPAEDSPRPPRRHGPWQPHDPDPFLTRRVASRTSMPRRRHGASDGTFLPSPTNVRRPFQPAQVLAV